MPGKKRRKPVLIVQHAQHEHPAAMRRALESQGIATLWLHPYRGESYPNVEEISGVISLGGPMGANDESEHPWISREIELLKKSVALQLPVVGICLGGQMLARALGSKVEKHKTAEVGWFPIELTPAGILDPIVGAAGERPTVYHWHEDTFHLPTDAVLLAQSQVCERQAFRLGNKIYGFQFHPEADHQLVLEWLSVSGIEDDIHAVRTEFGAETVQDSTTQRSHALKGEKGSLKITAAIGSLFRNEKASSPVRLDYSQLETWVTHRTILIAEFEGALQKKVHLKGQIATLLSISTGEFIIFQELNSLLWPIRLDDVLKIVVAD